VVEEAHRAGLPVTAHTHGTAAIRIALDVGVDGMEHVSFWSAEGIDDPGDLVGRIVDSRVAVGVTAGWRPVSTPTSSPWTATLWQTSWRCTASEPYSPAAPASLPRKSELPLTRAAASAGGVRHGFGSARMNVESKCEAAWLAMAMYLAGAELSRPDECAQRRRFRIAMRLSGLGHAVAFNAAVCSAHRLDLRASPYYVESSELADPGT
jgi:hypothetical protein